MGLSVYSPGLRPRQVAGARQGGIGGEKRGACEWRNPSARIPTTQKTGTGGGVPPVPVLLLDESSPPFWPCGPVNSLDGEEKLASDCGPTGFRHGFQQIFSRPPAIRRHRQPGCRGYSRSTDTPPPGIIQDGNPSPRAV